MIRAHREAILALLTPVTNLTTYDGVVPNLPTLPYAVLWVSAPHRETSRLCGIQSDADMTFSTTAVGRNANQIGWVQEKLHAVLVDVSPVVTGRACERIKHSDTLAMEIDYDVDPPILTAVDVWRFRSVPA